MKTEGNDSAHPVIQTDLDQGRLSNYHDNEAFGNVYSTGGLTKREYFAVMAMQGILANGGDIYPVCAEQAVIAADALITALNQKTHKDEK